ncbi:MAG: pirin family protein [Pseudomonadales bacterium]|nr:pirin family protein [Pseudomonadales bacterium]
MPNITEAEKMLVHYPYNNLGGADHGWLKSKHHFSFANYYNPKRMGFGKLRVVNDDWIRAGSGFPPHPHQNMEIISYIRSGAITHQDSEGNKGVTKAGVIQVMSAGKGIVHSEYNLEQSDLSFYQIWIETDQYNIQPRWESSEFPTQASSTGLSLLVSGFAEDNKNALFINQQARIFGGVIKSASEIEHPITHQAYVLAASGNFTISAQNQQIQMSQGDGAEVTKTKFITIKAYSDSEIVIIDAPR